MKKKAKRKVNLGARRRRALKRQRKKNAEKVEEERMKIVGRKCDAYASGTAIDDGLEFDTPLALPDGMEIERNADGSFKVDVPQPGDPVEIPERKRGVWEAEFRGIMERGTEGPFRWLFPDRRIYARGVVELLNGGDIASKAEYVCKQWVLEIRKAERLNARLWSRLITKTVQPSKVSGSPQES